MRHGPRLGLLGLLTLPGGCVEGPAPDLAIDLGRSCSEIALEVRDPAVLPGFDVHALALERTDGERAWALATDKDGELHLKAWPDGGDHDFSEFAALGALHLVPGAIEGETWVLLDSPEEVRVWRITDGEEGTLFAGPRLTDFPTPGEWTRRLVFLDQVAYVLSVPTVGDASTVELVLSRLSEDSLEPEANHALPLWQTCPEDSLSGPGSCQPPLLSGTISLELLGSTEGGSLSGAVALIGMYTSRMGEPPLTSAVYTTLVTNVELRVLVPGQPPTMIRRDLPYWTTNGPVAISPAHIAADSEGLYWLAGLVPAGEDAPAPMQDFVYRAERDAESVQAQILATADKQLRSHLLQIGGRAALGQISGDRWTIAPINRSGIDQQTTASLKIAPDARVSLAGRGQFLIRAGSGSRRVAATCRHDEPQ